MVGFLAALRYKVGSAGTLAPPRVPVWKITFNPETSYYGVAFHFERPRVHHQVDTFDSLEAAKRWADPWDERVWENQRMRTKPPC